MNAIITATKRVRAAITEGRGTLLSTALLIPIEPALAAELLPQGLHIHSARTQPRLFVMLSANHFGAWFGDMDYREAIIGLPDVCTSGGPPRMYYRRLYLNAALPRRLGVAIYGFEKTAAHINWRGLPTSWSAIKTIDDLPTQSNYRVDLGASLGPAKDPFAIDANWQTQAPPSPHAEFELWDVLSQPVITQAGRRHSLNAAHRHAGPFLETPIHTTALGPLRAVSGNLRFGAQISPAALAGIEMANVVAFQGHFAQVVGLPRRKPCSAG